MAKLTVKDELDYRSGGDRVLDFGAKYKAEIEKIYRHLNDLRQHQQTGATYEAPEDGQFEIKAVTKTADDGTVTTTNWAARNIANLTNSYTGQNDSLARQYAAYGNEANSGLDSVIRQTPTMGNQAVREINQASKNVANAANSTNKNLSGLVPQYMNAANNANKTNTSAVNAINRASKDVANSANNTNASLGKLMQNYKNAANYANSINANVSNDVSRNTNTANQTLGGLARQYANVANQTNGTLGSLQNGNLPTGYQNAMQNSIQSAVTNTMGKTLNSLGNRGVLNSSVTSAAMNDISKNAADSVAQQYQNNIQTVGGLANRQMANTLNANSANAGIYGNLINSATQPITTAASAQEAAQKPALNLWNASLGLNGSTTSALAAAAGKGTTTSTSHTSGGGGLLSGLMGGLL